MRNPRHPLFSLPILLLFQSLQLILSSTPLHPSLNTTQIQILQDVLNEISARQNWDMEGIKFSKLKVSKVRFGAAQSHDFRLQFGKNHLLFKFPAKVNTWNKLNKSSDNYFEEFVSDDHSSAVLDTFKLDGPFDLRVSEQDALSLELPLNVSQSGLKRVLVGEGITVEVKRARGVSFFQRLGVGSNSVGVNSGVTLHEKKIGFYPFWDSMCMPLLPVHVIGSASLVARKTRNPNAGIERSFLSEEMTELLPEKCYANNVCKIRDRPVHFLSLAMDKVEKILRSFLADRILQNGSSSFVRANVKASSMIQFQLEVEKNAGSSETSRGMAKDWRTGPSVERLWFDVLARVENRKLRPITIKKVRPFISVDSASWNNFMFNISFTKFPSVLVPPDALTLDVKW